MLNSYKTFIHLINDIENTETLYLHITEVMKVPLDCSDLLRWEWAQCVSAFDKLMHDLIRVGMMQSFNGIRPVTKKFKGYMMDYDTYEQMKISFSPGTIFHQRIILKNSTLSFQSPDKIADGLSYIWNESDKWLKIATYINVDKNSCVTTMRNIVNRRNQIVHEGDYIDPFSTQRQDILFEDVIDTKEFIKKLGNAIYNLVL